MEQGKNARFGNIKEKNLKTLFNMIAEHAGISRAQLAREAGLSKPAVSAMVDELISRGYVKMAGEGKSDQAGRKPICLKLNAQKGQFLTIALSSRSAACRVYDFALRQVEAFDLPIVYQKGCMQTLLENIRRASGKWQEDQTVALCITLPAATNADLSEIRSTVLDLPGDLNLLEETCALSLPGAKVLANETIAYVYAEQKFSCPEKENLIFVEVAEGVGAGIMIENRVFRGVSGSAGEFGHMSIDRNGKNCCCGRKGCLELAVSKPAILQRAVQAGVIKNGDGYAGIAAALAAGSDAAQTCMRGVAQDLAFGLGNMIAMFDIGDIVLGGGVEELGEAFLQMLRKETDRLLISGNYRTKNHLSIHYAALGEDAKNLGAAKYFCDHILMMTEEVSGKICFI